MYRILQDVEVAFVKRPSNIEQKLERNLKNKEYDD